MRFAVIAFLIAASLLRAHGVALAQAEPQRATAGRQDESLTEAQRKEQRVAQQQEQAADNSGNPAIAPFKWAGRLAYNDPITKTGFLCSAQFVGPRVLLTAAHCVYDIDKKSYFLPQDMIFILQYQNGVGTHTYHVQCTATLSGYSYPANYATLSGADKNGAFLTASQWDYAMLLVDADSITGSYTVQTDWKANWVGATRIGYPEAILGTEIVQRAHGLVFLADAIPIFGKSYPGLVVHWQDDTLFTEGSSGGAWVAAINSTEGAQNNILIGLNSFHVTPGLTAAGTTLPGAEFGPYFQAADYNALYKYTSNGCK